MSDYKNPFLAENHSAGGGKWDGRVVSITSAKFMLKPIMFGDGTPWLNSDGEPGVIHCLQVSGIADGDERERDMEYSIGGLVPTADGQFYEKRDGTPGELRKTSACSKFFEKLEACGFDMSNLVKDGEPFVSGLVGAEIEFKSEQRKNKDGSLKFSKKGDFPELDFWPERFVSYNANGSQASANEEITNRATDIVAGLLEVAPEGKLTRKDLIKELGVTLANDSDKNAILRLALSPEFHDQSPWSTDGTTISKVPF